MDSVNWGGGAYSNDFVFTLEFRLGGGDLLTRQVLVHVTSGDRGQDVASNLVQGWNVAHGGVPFAFRMGAATYFACHVNSVTLGTGPQAVQLPSNGKAVTVPGNDGLVAWCE